MYRYTPPKTFVAAFHFTIALLPAGPTLLTHPPVWYKPELVKTEKELEDEELKELQATLANIEEARPFEDLTVGSAPTQRNCPTTDVLSGQRGRRCSPSYRRGCRDHDQEGQVDRAR